MSYLFPGAVITFSMLLDPSRLTRNTVLFCTLPLALLLVGFTFLTGTWWQVISSLAWALALVAIQYKFISVQSLVEVSEAAATSSDENLPPAAGDAWRPQIR